MNDEELMRMAIAEAKLAEEHGDIPIGAIVVLNDEVLSSRHNERELQNDPTAHAEMLAIRDAAKALGTSRLDGAILVSTLEPCPMCAGALLQARMGTVVFGAYDRKRGGLGGCLDLAKDSSAHHHMRVVGPWMQDRAADQLESWFRQRRRQNR